MPEAADSSRGLPDDAYVYRAVSKTKVEGQLVKAIAYLRRPNLDHDGITVCRTQEGARMARDKPPFSVARIKASSIRSLGLDVVQSGDDPDHFAITGVPYYHTDSPPPNAATQKKARDLAEALADASEIVWLRD